MDSNAAFEQLRLVLSSIINISDNDWRDIAKQLEFQCYQKNDHLMQADKLTGKFWFVSSGLVRNYYLTENGKEFNKSFIRAPGFCGSIREMVKGAPSRFSIQAMEETATIIIPVNWFKSQAEINPEFLKLSNQIAQQLAIKKEAREAELLLDDATTRYQNFITQNPDLENRLPAYHIASYLGITEVALSRLKAKLKA